MTDETSPVENVVWVSGASSGIGRALVHRIPRRPAKIIGVSRRGLTDPPTVGSGSDTGVSYEDLKADLSVPEGWATVNASFHTELSRGRVAHAYLLHCAASVGPIGFAGEVNPGEYQQAVVLNSVTPQVLGQAFVTAVNEADIDGSLLMLSSGSSSGTYRGWSAYKPGKAAVDEWVRAVGGEQSATRGRCRVLSVTPGLVETPMQEALRETSSEDFPRRDKFVAAQQAGKTQDPEHVADQIWQILQEEFENGAVLDLRELTPDV